MSIRTTLLLALVLAGLGTYLYFVELPQEAAQTEAKSLLRFDKDKVSKIELAYPDRRITLAKSAGEWKIAEPIEAEADPTAVSNLINALASAEVTQSYDNPGADLAPYGLDKPSATVSLTLEDNSRLPQIKIGKKASVGYSTYVAKGDDPKVYVTSASLQYGIDKKVKDLREKRLVTFEDEEVQKLELASRGKDTVELAKEGEKWQIVRPAKYAADDTEVRSLLSSLRSLRANDFVTDSPENLAQYGLDDPQLTVTLFLGKDLAKKAVLIGKQINEKDASKGYFAKRDAKDTIYEIAEYALKNLSKDVPALRDKRVLGLDPKEVAKAVVKRMDGKGFTLVKSTDDKWSLEGKVEGKPREYPVSHFAEDVATLRASEVVADDPADLKQYGLDQPQIKVSLYGKDGKLLGTVIGTKKSDDEIYVMRQDGRTVFGARSYVFARMDKKLDDMVEKPAEKKAKKS